MTWEFTTGADVAQQYNTFQIDFGRFGPGPYEGPEYNKDTVWVDNLEIRPL